MSLRLLTLSALCMGSVLPSQTPDRYAPTLIDWYFGGLSESAFLAHPSTLTGPVQPRFVDVNVDAAGTIQFSSVNGAPGSPFADPAWTTAIAASAAQAEAGVRALGQRPADVAGYLNFQSSLRYALATESDRGRNWQWVNATSRSPLQSWLTTNPTYRPYCIDRVDVPGGGEQWVMLAEVTPPGEGGGFLVFDQTPAQLQAIIDGGQFIADVDVRLDPQNQLISHAAVQDWGNRPRHFTKVNAGLVSEAERPGQLWAGYDRIYSNNFFVDPSGGFRVLALVTEDSPFGRPASYVTQQCGSSSIGISAPGGLPVSGGQLTLTLTGAPSNTLAVLAGGDDRANWTGFGGVRLPFELLPFNAPNCYLVVDAQDTFGGVTDVFGAWQRTFTIPAWFRRGDRYYFQFLVLDPSANAGRIAATDALLLQVY